MDKKYISEDDIKYQLANLRQLTFEVTDSCNLKCKYCAYGEFYNDYDIRENSMISLPAAIKLIDYLVPIWNSNQNMSNDRNVTISFYGGEPLLNMPFIESIVNYSKKIDCKNRSFTFSMTTNGLLLERYMDFLVTHDFSLLISLDGNEYNTSYRTNKAGKPSYFDIIRNVESLRQEYPEYFERKVNFNAVLHNRNSVSDIYHFFKSRYNKIPSIGELNNIGIRHDKIELFKKMYENSYESLHQSENYEEIEKDMFTKLETYKTVTTFIHQNSEFVFKKYTDLLYGKPDNTIPTGTCRPFSKKIFVTVNGKILPCERIGQHFGLGKVTESGVQLNLKAIVDKYNNYYNKLNHQCSKCYRQYSCKQCIFHLNDLDGSPICYGFTNEKAFENHKAVQLNFLRNNPEEYYRIMEEVIVY